MLWFVVTWYVKVLPVCFGVGRIFIILFLPPISRAWCFGQIKYKERNKWCSMYETTSSFRQQRVHTYGFFLYDLAITIKTKMLWFVVTWSVESFTYFFQHQIVHTYGFHNISTCTNFVILPPVSRAWLFGQIKYMGQKNKWYSMSETIYFFRQLVVRTYGFHNYQHFVLYYVIIFYYSYWPGSVHHF